MKRFNIFATMALTMVIGLGAAIGIGSARNEIKCAEALTTTGRIYCKMAYSWWTADSAAVGAYCWNSKNNSQKNADWPGVRMTPLVGEENAWYYEIPSGSSYDKVIFTRVNGSGTIADWSAKTADLTIPTDLNNFYTITSSSAVWGDPGVTGNWSAYADVEPSTSTNRFYVHDYGNNIGDSIHVYGFDQSPSVKPMQWPGTTSGITNQTIGGVSMKQILLSTSYPHFIINNGSNNKQTGNIEDLSDHVDDVLVIKSDLTTEWREQSYYTDSVTIQINEGDDLTMTTTDGNTYSRANVSVKAGDKITAKKGSTTLEIHPENTTNNNYNNGGILFSGTVTIYLHYDALDVFVTGISQLDGYYLMVDGSIIGDGPLPTNPDNSNEVYITQHVFKENEKINIFHIGTGAQKYYEYKNPNLNNSSAEGCFERYADGIKCLSTDYYDLYYDTTEANSCYIGISAATYCNSYAVAFNTAIGTICTAIVGGTKSIADLKAAWKTQYDNWVQMGEDNIYAQGIMTNYDKTLPDNIGLCVTKYEYIVGKYGDALAGTGYTVNFMNRSITPSARMSLFKNIIDLNTTGTVAIVVISSLVAIGAFAGYFFYKKKKED